MKAESLVVQMVVQMVGLMAVLMVAEKVYC